MNWIYRLVLGPLLFLVVVLMLVATLTWEPDRQLSELLPHWGQPPSNFIELDGMQVHFRDTGQRDERPTIVLIHMQAGSLHHFQNWQTALSKKYRVISLDLPGFGLTGATKSGNYKIDNYARFILKLLDTLNIEKAVLVGHALGGEIAWRTAVMFQDRITRLVLINANGYEQNHWFNTMSRGVARINALQWIGERILPYSMVSMSLHYWYGNPNKVSKKSVDRMFEINLRVGNRRALIEFLNQQTPGSHQHLIREVKQPTLVLWGEEDRLLPAEFGYRFCQEIATCTLVRLPKLGHLPMEEDPTASLRPVLQFLSKPA